MALEFPIPPGGWRLSRYACRLILEETEPDIWESFNHWTLERWHTESVPAAMAGFIPATGNKEQGLSVSIGRSQLTTDSAKTFICTSDAFQPYSERSAHVRRRQRWEHFTEPAVIDLTLLNPPLSAATPAWTMLDYTAGLELDEITDGDWQTQNHIYVKRQRNEYIDLAFRVDTGRIAGGISAALEGVSVNFAEKYVCTMDEITIISETLGYMHRSQDWEHYSARTAIDPPSTAP
tara:strand:+ start:4401 stop:5105 length:705 start_codon:yes stop_codon:yes gene_type:complete